jgi:Zn-finger nucleic acid-binding protein
MKCEGDKMYDKPGKCPVCKMELKKVNKDIEVAHYQCPMKCEGDKMYDKPGKCPVCKMDLKKVKEDSGHEGHNH